MIRKMLLSDIEAIIFAELEVFKHTLGYEMLHNEITDNDFAHYFVMEDQGIIGYVGLWLNDDIGQIVNFLIKPKYQNQGFGKEFMQFIMHYFKENHIHIISLEVRESNIKAIHLYESFGFKKSYKRVKYYDNQEDAHVLIWRDNDADISSRK